MRSSWFAALRRRSRTHLENQLAVALGGRVAEELAVGDEDEVTTGAAGDLQQVTHTAKMMVAQWGFSGRIGQLNLGGSEQSFLGQARRRRLQPASPFRPTASTLPGSDAAALP